MYFAFLMANVFAIYLIVSGLFIITRGKSLPMILKDFFAHPAIVYLAGVILVFLGSTLLLQNNVWFSPVRTVVYVFGWLALIKGLIYIFFPKFLAGIPVQKLRPYFGFIGAVLMIAGIYLFYIL